MTYADADAYLLTLPRFADQGATAYQPGLERMEALMDVMDRPHEAFPSVHVGGTNGKGSTASMLAAIATASGRRTGLHTSPHLVHLNERFRIDGVPAPEAWTAQAVARYREAFEALRPSFFEATTALAFRYFADEEVDLAVIEVGLGGRFDATNVLRPRLAIITSIGLDHTDILGDTVAAIACEKAGIVKPGVPVLTGAEQPDALAAIRDAATSKAAPFHHIQNQTEVYEVRSMLEGLALHVRTPLRSYDDLRIGLPGRHQQTNALLALRAAELLFDDLEPEAVYTGLRDVRSLAGLRGRLEVVQHAPLVVLDVAHNADGIAAALAFIQQHRTPHGRLFVLLGLMRDKDTTAIATRLAEMQAAVFSAVLPGERAHPADALADRLHAQGVSIVGTGSVADGWRWFQQQAAPQDALLITGSHQMVAQALSIYGAAPFTEPTIEN